MDLQLMLSTIAFSDTSSYISSIDVTMMAFHGDCRQGRPISALILAKGYAAAAMAASSRGSCSLDDQRPWWQRRCSASPPG